MSPSPVTLPSAEQSATIALACAGVAGHPAIADAITKAGSALELLELINDAPENSGLELDLIERIDRVGTPAAVATALEATRRAGLRLVSPNDPEWPAGLRDLGRAQPRLLWAAGAINDGVDVPVAVTGSTHPTPGARRHFLEVTVQLLDGGWKVASSFRPGVDRQVIDAAIAAKGKALLLAHDPQLLRTWRDHPRITVMSENPPAAPLGMRTARRAHSMLAVLASRVLVVDSQISSPPVHTGVAAKALGRPLAVLAGSITEGDDYLRHDFGAREIQTAKDLLRLT
ncbi:MAG: DNA-processing protein DprA [Rhodoglobus sp.]